MFYNDLLWQLRKFQTEIKNAESIGSFTTANQAYKAYGGQREFKLCNSRQDRTYE
jgi:hypothetical protein